MKIVTFNGTLICLPTLQPPFNVFSYWPKYNTELSHWLEYKIEHSYWLKGRVEREDISFLLECSKRCSQADAFSRENCVHNIRLYKCGKFAGFRFSQSPTTKVFISKYSTISNRTLKQALGLYCALYKLSLLLVAILRTQHLF